MQERRGSSKHQFFERDIMHVLANQIALSQILNFRVCLSAKRPTIVAESFLRSYLNIIYLSYIVILGTRNCLSGVDGIFSRLDIATKSQPNLRSELCRMSII